jgi:hypothetical protein
MANIVTGNPLIIDTPHASTLVISSPIKITAIVWDSGTSGAIADQAVLQDKDGKTKWAATLAVAKDTINSPVFNPPIFSHGLLCPTLGRGILYVYFTGTGA